MDNRFHIIQLGTITVYLPNTPAITRGLITGQFRKPLNAFIRKQIRLLSARERSDRSRVAK